MFAATSTFLPPTILLDIALMAILVIVAFAIVRMRSLFGIVMLQGVYSLVCAAWFVNLDAVDVAFTEAAVGAGVSTVLMLSAMLLADRKSAPVPRSRQWAPLLICIFAGAAMFYAIGDMPGYGDAYSPANSYVGIDYMAKTAEEIKIPNVVTAVLASYRGYDTFGEAVVIFSAGLGVLLLLGLNGNAGRWVARVQGQRVADGSAPAAQIKREEGANPALTQANPVIHKAAPAPAVAEKPIAKKQVPKKQAPKKPAAKAKTAKKTTAKTAAKKPPATTVAKKAATTKRATATKKPTAAKSSTAKSTAVTKKPAAKKTTTKKAASKKTATKKTTAKKTVTKSTKTKAVTAKAPAKRRGRPPKPAAAKTSTAKTTTSKTAASKSKPSTRKTIPKLGGTS